MTAEMRCEQVRELAPELALDVATGEERDVALRHVATCSECRRLISELSTVGEELLLQVPQHEPPVGFESRVLAAIAEPTTSSRPEARSRPRRWLTAVVVAAAVVLATALGAGSMFLATAGDRRLAEGYRAVLVEGQGSFFAAAPLEGPQGRIGTVFGYQGRPSWIMVSLPDPVGEQRFRLWALTDGGRYLALGDVVLDSDDRTWGRQIPVDLSELRELRFVGSDDQATFTASFGSSDPWE
jgi:hypothetical protein